MSDETPALELAGLTVRYGRTPVRASAPANVVDGIDLRIPVGETYGLVGESGCGKTTIVRAITRSLPASAHVSGGIAVAGRDVCALDRRALRAYRSRDVATVHQEPASALNPTMRVGEQIAEVFENLGLSRRDAGAAAIDGLARVAMPNAAAIARRYPHQLSGGQQQRVLIAIALATRPRLLMLDEPTTGLDATTEAGVLALIDRLRGEIDAAVLFVSHDLALVRRLCDRVGVLYSGRIVEEGPAGDVVADPRHPYTDGLVRCVSRLAAPRGTAVAEPLPGTFPAPANRPAGCAFSDRCHAATDECRTDEPPLAPDLAARLVRCWHPGARPPDVEQPLDYVSAGTPAPNGTFVRIEGVTKRFGDVVACDDVHLTIGRGEVVGLVGESGSGKTTLARCLAGLAAYEGRIEFDGVELAPVVERRRRDVRERLQMVFQSPDSTLNPRHTGRQVLRRAIRRLGGTMSPDDLARTVRLDPGLLPVPTRALSGGQKQRVAIARAFAGRAALVVCDEPVSSLDVSGQAAVLQLLTDLQHRDRVSYLFISHDLRVVRHLADRIAVMYLGQIVEIGSTDDVLGGPRHHPYTATLLAAAAARDGDSLGDAGATGEHRRVSGAALMSEARPAGCRFSSLCPRAIDRVCDAVPPPWRTAGEGHEIRCHLDIELLAEGPEPAAPVRC